MEAVVALSRSPTCHSTNGLKSKASEPLPLVSIHLFPHRSCLTTRTPHTMVQVHAQIHVSQKQIFPLKITQDTSGRRSKQHPSPASSATAPSSKIERWPGSYEVRRTLRGAVPGRLHPHFQPIQNVTELTPPLQKSRKSRTTPKRGKSLGKGLSLLPTTKSKSPAASNSNAASSRDSDSLCIYNSLFPAALSLSL
eukprot:2156763-Rhodomonas_salina.7